MKRTIILSLAVLLTAKLSAQIEGGITDQANKGIPGALITATDTTGKLVDSVRADKRGFYFFKRLPIGKYKIEVKATGFRSSINENIRVINEDPVDNKKRNDISGATRLDIILTKN